MDVRSCPAAPDWVGQISDSYNNSNTNENVCMQRAPDYAIWCQSDRAVSAAYIENNQVKRNTVYLRSSSGPKNCGTIDTSKLFSWGGASWVQELFADEGDTNEVPTRSFVQLYENGRLLGPAHSLHLSIINTGSGRFSHWYNNIIFSASDNSDPRTNGRVYTYGVSDGPCPIQICDRVTSTGLPTEGHAHVLSPFSPSGFVGHRQQGVAGDTSEQPTSSPLLIYESARLTGRAHTLHQDIRTVGRGRFSHWYSSLYFSATDNTSPNTNGRAYYYGMQVCTRERAPALVIAINSDSGSYTAYENDTVIASGAHFANDVLQPALDRLSARGGGVIRLTSSQVARPFRMASESIRGRSRFPTFEVDLFSNVSILGAKKPDGSPDTVISIDANLGNVFDAFFKENILISNLRIEANNKGNYIFSSLASRDVSIENAWVYKPNWTAFGHRAGTNITYKNCKAFGENPMYGHGWAVGGSYRSPFATEGGYLVIQDTGTKIINGEASGFAHEGGGQGINIRPNYADWGEDYTPSLPNTGVLISGGKYYNNRTGIHIGGSKDALVENVEIYNNAANGIEAVTPFPHSSNTGYVAPENQLQLVVRGGYIGWNGYGSLGGFDARAGIYLQSDKPLLLQNGARVENNHPSNYMINFVRSDNP